MTNEKRDWLYYLLDFKFIIDDKVLYQRIRDIIYRGHDFNDVTFYKETIWFKPSSDNSVVYSFKEWIRDKKIDQIIS